MELVRHSISRSLPDERRGEATHRGSCFGPLAGITRQPNLVGSLRAAFLWTVRLVALDQGNCRYFGFVFPSSISGAKSSDPAQDSQASDQRPLGHSGRPFIFVCALGFVDLALPSPDSR